MQPTGAAGLFQVHRRPATSAWCDACAPTRLSCYLSLAAARLSATVVVTSDLLELRLRSFGHRTHLRLGARLGRALRASNLLLDNRLAEAGSLRASLESFGSLAGQLLSCSAPLSVHPADTWA